MSKASHSRTILPRIGRWTAINKYDYMILPRIIIMIIELKNLMEC